MGIVEVFIIAVGLSMDAFAASVCKGLTMKADNGRLSKALVISLFFGGFQALMPLIGYVLGSQFASFVGPLDHWIAFVLLGFIGGKMIWDATHEDDAEESETSETDKLDLKEILGLAVATSIDALVVGCSLAFMNVNVVMVVVTIGITTFALSFGGVYLGSLFGTRYNKPASIVGGAVLILIGIKTLLSHLGFI